MVAKKIIRGALVLLGVAIVVFVGANAVDYYRFHRVISRLKHLTEAQLRAMGDAAAKITKPSRDAIPAGFEA